MRRDPNEEVLAANLEHLLSSFLIDSFLFMRGVLDPRDREAFSFFFFVILAVF